MDEGQFILFAIVVSAFLLNGADIVAEHTGNKTGRALLYVIPASLASVLLLVAAIFVAILP